MAAAFNEHLTELSNFLEGQYESLRVHLHIESPHSLLQSDGNGWVGVALWC